jgi:hypothetical protein
MSRLDEWVIKSPYSADDLAYMNDQNEDRRKSTRIYDSYEYTDWLIEKVKSLMKGTWLEQDLVPIVHNNHPWAFGIMSGPRADFESCTLHEIAHAIQLKKKDYRSRLQFGNRFQQPKSSTQVVLGRSYYEPFTMEVALCEAEAAGINLVLLEILGYEIDHKLYFEHWAGVCQYLPDWYHGGGKENREMILQKAIEMYYLVWNTQQSMMEHRYKNFCSHVAKLREKHPDMLPQACRPVKAKV